MRLRTHQRVGFSPFVYTIICLLSAGCFGDRPVYYRIAAKYTVRDPQFTQTVGTLLGPPLVGGNQVDTLINGKEIFPAMLDAIHGAKKSITLETFIFWKATIGKQFTDALVRARASGCEGAYSGGRDRQRANRSEVH